MNCKVRYAKAGDEKKIAELLVDIHRQHADGRPDLFGGGSPKFSEKDLVEKFGNKDFPFLVAEDKDGNVIGYALCKLDKNTSSVQGSYTSLYVEDLNVDSSARKKGVGKALMSRVEELASELGCYNITLNVWSFNKGAIAFYEKDGFSCQRMIMEKIIE